MQDFVNLVQVATPLILGVLAYKLNDKKEDHSYIQKNSELSDKVKDLEGENEKLRRKNKALKEKIQKLEKGASSRKRLDAPFDLKKRKSKNDTDKH